MVGGERHGARGGGREGEEDGVSRRWRRPGGSKVPLSPDCPGERTPTKCHPCSGTCTHTDVQVSTWLSAATLLPTGDAHTDGLTQVLEHAEGSRQQRAFMHRWPCLIWVWLAVGSPA